MAPPVKKSNIPRVNDLKKKLDYDGSSELLRCRVFRHSVDRFRKEFKSSQGWRSISIRDWESEEHQSALDEMVQSYLEDKNGKRFWPDDASDSYFNRFKYSTDSVRIKEIMKQLFWKQNDQEFRNTKNRNKKKASSSRAKPEREPSQDLGLDTGVGDGEYGSHDAATPGTPRSSTYINGNSPFRVQSNVISPAPHSAQPHMSTERLIAEDPYRVTDSPEPRNLRPSNQPTFEVMPTGIDSNGRQVAPVANMDPSTDRPRSKARSSTRMSSKKAGKQPAGVGKTRTSTRKRKSPNVIGRAPDNAVEEALQSPQRNPTPDVIERSAPSETNNEVPSEISPVWNRERANRSRATVSEVTDERLSVSSFAWTLSSNTGLDLVDTSNSVNHERPFEQTTMTEAAPRPSIEVKSDSRQTSVISLSSSSAPMETQHAVGERLLESEARPLAPPPSVGQSRVEFTYCVVCRYPQLQSIYWKPEGSFRNKTLSKLEEELPIQLDWSQFQYLHFQLTAPNTRADHLVRHGSEDQFDFMKRRLAVIIRDCITNTPRDKTILVGIVIEPLSDENALKRSAENEDMDFEW